VRRRASGALEVRHVVAVQRVAKSHGIGQC
jgi:hypothetical protein